MEPIVKKTAEDLEREKKLERKQTLRRVGGAAYIVVCLSLLFGGMFAGINWLVIAGLVALIGGAFVLSVVWFAVNAIKSDVQKYKKHGGSKTPYIIKNVVCLTLVLLGAAFVVLGFVLDVYYFIGAIVAFFVMIILYFGWRH